MTASPPQPAVTRVAAARQDVARSLAILFCLLFFLEGLVFIPYVGIQNDEALFGAAIYPPWEIEHSAEIHGHRVPIMLMSYVGALKGWMYQPVFSVLPPSAWSVRIPVLLIGAVTLWLFFELALRSAGVRVACVATALLATDVLYVLTTGLDWGPVALQHLFLIAGALLLFFFHKSGKRMHLGAAFLLFGLGLWDKAVFLWPLAGLTVAAIVVFPRELLAKLRLRNLAAAAVAFVIGAAPLISYNQAADGKTLHNNGEFSTARFGHKFLELQKSLEGSCLFGYIVREDVPLEAAKPRNAIEKFSMDLSEAAGHRRAGVLALACILAFALLPWFWNTPARKPMLFALVFSVATWLQMACTWKAGGGAHHTVLLWPFPHLFVAAALAQASRYLGRAGLPALVAVTAAICGTNLLVLNEHFAQIVERGTTPAWSDATAPLSACLRHTEARHVYVTDWGIAGSLRLLNEGKLPLEVAADRFLRSGSGQLPAPALGAQGAIFVGHTEGNEVTGGVALPLEELARSTGLHKRVIRVIDDRVGRPTFEIYRFAR